MLSLGSSTHLSSVSSGTLLPPPSQSSRQQVGSASDLQSRDEMALARGVSQTFPEFKLPGTGAVELETEFSVVLPHKTYRFRAETAQDRDSWVDSLHQSTQALFHTCLFCWKNVDPSSSGLSSVCRGYLHIQLNPKLVKQWDKRWMVCTTNKRESSTHVVYYDSQEDEGHKPALGCIHLYEGENRVSVYASDFETREDSSGVEYTVYKLNVRRGEDRLVVYKRWSKCDGFNKQLAKEHRVPPAVQLPRKWSNTNDKDRLEKRRCQLNHYFAELSGWANREGLDLWDSSVSKAFTDFVFSADSENGDDDRSTFALRMGGTSQSANAAEGSPEPALDSWDDSYATMRRERGRMSGMPSTAAAPVAPPGRLGSFAFGVSQSIPQDGGGGSTSPGQVSTGSPREGCGANQLAGSPAQSADGAVLQAVCAHAIPAVT